MTIQIPHPSVVLHSGDIALASGLAGEVRVDDLHGLFVGDTRVLSTYPQSMLPIASTVSRNGLPTT